jgi:formylglycine-generating enzyme required for sulfatase activity
MRRIQSIHTVFQFCICVSCLVVWSIAATDLATTAPAHGRAPSAATISRSPLVYIRRGCFLRGQKHGSFVDAPSQRICLSAFWIDRNEVSVKQYAQCVRSGLCSQPIASSPASWRGSRCNWGLRGRSGHPINCVTWSQAMAFCWWIGRALPTEAQWEYAARGKASRRYPWGNAKPTCRRTVFYDFGTKGTIQGRPSWLSIQVYRLIPSSFWKRGIGCGKHTTWPINSKLLRNDVSPFGVYAMAGNVSEWTRDCYDPNFYQKSQMRNPVNARANCASRVFRGGSWEGSVYSLDLAVRSHSHPGNWPNSGFLAVAHKIGFRCVSTGGK